jgi:hypothetical protein
LVEETEPSGIRNIGHVHTFPGAQVNMTCSSTASRISSEVQVPMGCSCLGSSFNEEVLSIALYSEKKTEGVRNDDGSNPLLVKQDTDAGLTIRFGPLCGCAENNVRMSSRNCCEEKRIKVLHERFKDTSYPMFAPLLSDTNGSGSYSSRHGSSIIFLCWLCVQVG